MCVCILFVFVCGGGCIVILVNYLLFSFCELVMV